MEKSIYTAEYTVLLDLLREARRAAEVSQIELAQRIGRSQSFVSKMEVGQRRIDIIQLRSVCKALGTSLPEFVARLEAKLATRRKRG